jgi:transposase
MTYSLDFRKKVLQVKTEEKLSYEETAKRFQIGKTTLVRWHSKLEPQIKRNKPATFHKDTRMQDALAAAGHTLVYLPPYSPDLNPIVHKWAQLKSIRRKLSCSLDHLFSRHLI